MALWTESRDSMEEEDDDSNEAGVGPLPDRLPPRALPLRGGCGSSWIGVMAGCARRGVGQYTGSRAFWQAAFWCLRLLLCRFFGCACFFLTGTWEVMAANWGGGGHGALGRCGGCPKVAAVVSDGRCVVWFGRASCPAVPKKRKTNVHLVVGS